MSLRSIFQIENLVNDRRDLASFKQRPNLRMQLMVEALAQAVEKAGNTDAVSVALQLEKARVTMAGQTGSMRAEDHQFQQPLVVGVMAKQGSPGVPFDVEGSGYGFKVMRQIKAEQARMPTTCKMVRPS